MALLEETLFGSHDKVAIAIQRLKTFEPPEVIYFMRENYPDVIVDYRGTTMWQLIVKKGMPPTRMVRYCCDELRRAAVVDES